MKNKKFQTAVTTTILAGALVAAMPAGAQAQEISFKDVKETHHFYDAVKKLSADGIIKGYEDGTYRPGENMTRAQAAKVIALSLGLDTKNVKNPNFKDVSEKNPYYGYIAALVQEGIIKGYDDQTFKPNGSLTRAHMAKMLTEGFDLEENKLSSYLPFKDVNSKQWFADYIQTLYAHNITTGKTADTFEPNANVTRGQMASFLYRASGFNLTLMHFNDTHAQLDNGAKRVTAVNELRANKPYSLLLDAGDVFSGSLYFNEFKGQADLAIMNLLNVDAMTFGNHEFDLGESEEGHKALVDFIKAANFPFVSSNVDFSKDELFTGLFQTKIESNPEKANIYTGIVKEVKGEKIGIFGLTTAETEYIASPNKVTFSNYIEDAKKMVAEFEKMGINKIVALTHIGYDDNPNVDNDLELAKAVKGIDVIVGGHSHTTLAEPVVVGENDSPTIIVQTGQYAENLGTLDVTFNEEGKIISHAGKLIKVADKAENPEAKAILKKYADKIQEIKTTESGAVATAELINPREDDNSVRKNETPLGNIITDGMLKKAKEYNEDVIMAFQNGGGIRAGIDAGPITIGEIITVLPFGNTLATMELTGAEIKEAFEISLKELPDRENGGFLHVAGAQVKYDSTKPVGERVVSISYKNGETYTEIEADKKYIVATNAFTAKGGDGYTVFEKAYKEGRVTDLGLSDWENFRDHLISLETVVPKVEGRIVDVSKK